MGAARNTRQDNRKLNVQPNEYPAAITVAVLLEGEELGTAAIPQAAKLSANGNVTYSGGIKKGWRLEGEPNSTLRTLSFVVDGTPLKVSESGVHSSEKGNPTVGHMGVISLPVAGGEPRRYMAQVYATFSVAKGAYSLSVRLFPAPSVVGGPAIAPGTRLSGAFDLTDLAAAA